MDIQIDTREKQRAIRKILKTFDDNGVKHFSSKLLVGDYMSLDNPRLIIDRKQNLQELCGNVCQQHERFKRELLKAINAGIQLAPELSWITVLKKRFFPQKEITADSGLDFACDFPFDFMNEKRGTVEIEVDHIIPSDFEMIIYGPCVNPKVLMNGYPYEVLTTLEKNEYLIINSSEQTIMKYLSNGTIANLFDVRGYDYSVFEKIPSGLISVNWSGDFGIDLYVFLKRKEAAW